MNWQKRLRLVLGVAVLALAGGVAWYLTRERPAGEVVAAPTARREGDHGDRERGLHAHGERKVLFTLRPERYLAYPDGRIKSLLHGDVRARRSPPMDSRRPKPHHPEPGGAGDPTKFDAMHCAARCASRGQGTVARDRGGVYNDLTGHDDDKHASIKRATVGSGTGRRSIATGRSSGCSPTRRCASAPTRGRERDLGRAASPRREVHALEESVHMTRDGESSRPTTPWRISRRRRRHHQLELRGNSRITAGRAATAACRTFCPTKSRYLRPETGSRARRAQPRGAPRSPEVGAAAGRRFHRHGLRGRRHDGDAARRDRAVELKIPARATTPRRSAGAEARSARRVAQGARAGHVQRRRRVSRAAGGARRPRGRRSTRRSETRSSRSTALRDIKGRRLRRQRPLPRQRRHRRAPEARYSVERSDRAQGRHRRLARGAGRRHVQATNST